MKNHIFKHQALITIFLLTLFSILIIIKILNPEKNLDIPFSLIAGWLGIVIGFFFNKKSQSPQGTGYLAM
jgi:predicted membrane channel-forming protein YqfA (hemolysin III family)